jgi:hypothetical protein
MTDAEHQMWTQWKPHSIRLTRTEMAQYVPSRTRAGLRDWLYTVGIKPDEYLCKRVDQKQRGWSRYGIDTAEFEIRLKDDMCLALVKMALL